MYINRLKKIIYNYFGNIYEQITSLVWLLNKPNLI